MVRNISKSELGNYVVEQGNMFILVNGYDINVDKMIDMGEKDFYALCSKIFAKHQGDLKVEGKFFVCANPSEFTYEGIEELSNTSLVLGVLSEVKTDFDLDTVFAEIANVVEMR